MPDHISEELMEIALNKADGISFEKFAKSFFSAIEGKNFVPLGGTKDGGADGVYLAEGYKTFYQMTRQQNHRDKIRKTVSRLREFGREVNRIVYASSRSIPHIDTEEEFLGEELNIQLRIRDQEYFVRHVNDSHATISAYKNHLQSFVSFLFGLKRDAELDKFQSSSVKDPSVFVFLQHELSTLEGNQKLIHSITDTMILWSLSETDPDKGIFLNEEELTAKIYDYFPWVKPILSGEISRRLKVLRSAEKQDRQIRWYKKTRAFCLPFETREKIANEIATDEVVQLHFVNEIKQMASNLFDADDGQYEIVSQLVLRVIHLVFENQGLVFSHFINSKVEDKSSPALVVADLIDEVLKDSKIVNNIEEYRDYLEKIMREVFYKTSSIQRKYLNNLSRTYVLLFSLQAEPRVVEFFNTMSSHFRLFLGSDILVKAISERYLSSEHQSARNLLKIANESGVELLLSESVLQEVYTHLRATFWEFYNHFLEHEQFITNEISRNSDKILIRSYFYAKSENKVKSWKSFIEQFVSYENLQEDKGLEEIRKYLVAEYNLKFVSNSELESVSNPEKVRILKENLMTDEIKDNENLAYNTALLVHGVYGMRRKNNEQGSVSELGYKTWWMTNQSKIVPYTNDIVDENRSDFIMRPDFLLNFIALSPNCHEVRRGFKNIFPSNFGIQLGNRLSKEAFEQVLSKVDEWNGFEDGRIIALVSEMSDKLKSNRLKRYYQTL